MKELIERFRTTAYLVMCLLFTILIYLYTDGFITGKSDYFLIGCITVFVIVMVDYLTRRYVKNALLFFGIHLALIAPSSYNCRKNYPDGDGSILSVSVCGILENGFGGTFPLCHQHTGLVDIYVCTGVFTCLVCKGNSDQCGNLCLYYRNYIYAGILYPRVSG